MYFLKTNFIAIIAATGLSSEFLNWFGLFVGEHTYLINLLVVAIITFATNKLNSRSNIKTCDSCTKKIK